ncbi:hypothetical protein AAU57_14790 [Nonlabens sp. YIK11]|uniref:hypothetical protein n=1 Tax=Nonlabens sp. YIK11 TaxID=1453349 RepID=UPI0006DC0C5C|nr:hypothetical protein [Nonlabens sp. YIK11]KQC31875.1 hypothetical protein AAU57_14790 [Nonlabens sp. YIK11]
MFHINILKELFEPLDLEPLKGNKVYYGLEELQKTTEELAWKVAKRQQKQTLQDICHNDHMTIQAHNNLQEHV